jgi:DNA-binding MarR family transcriptional regulator
MSRTLKRGEAPAVSPIQELVERVGIEVRRMAAQSVMRSQAIAEQLGLHTTDLECLDLIYLHGRVLAGELAQATGLTSGAVTALIDRLETGGYVVREGDPTDRRRRYVRIRSEAIKPIQAVYRPMQEEMIKLWSSYSPRDLRMIADFLSRSTRRSVDCVEGMSSRAASAPVRQRRRPSGRKKGHEGDWEAKRASASKSSGGRRDRSATK